MEFAAVSIEMDISGLKNIVSSTATVRKALPGYEGTTVGLYGYVALRIDCDEMYPGLFISDGRTACDKVYLRRIGITHIVNAAEGIGPGFVNTSPEFYADLPIVYMGLPLVDSPDCSVLQHSNVFVDFIGNAIRNGGKVLVNCFRGRSRSAAVVITYLRMQMGMPVPMALRMCCRERNINPNDGFLAQLLHLENCLTG